MASNWKDDPKGYMNKYVRDNVLYKRINFSVNNPDEKAMYDWLCENYGSRKLSQYVKSLIAEDMKRKRNAQ